MTRVLLCLGFTLRSTLLQLKADIIILRLISLPASLLSSQHCDCISCVLENGRRSLRSVESSSILQESLPSRPYPTTRSIYWGEAFARTGMPSYPFNQIPYVKFTFVGISHTRSTNWVARCRFRRFRGRTSRALSPSATAVASFSQTRRHSKTSFIEPAAFSPYAPMGSRLPKLTSGFSSDST